MFNKEYNKIFLFFLILFLVLFFSYRDFLVNYRSMLLIDYFPYYRYQDHLIYLLTGDKSFADDLPMNARFLGIYLQLFFYKFLPCIQLTNINLADQHVLFECTTFSLAILNYVCKYLFLIIFFFYVKKKLKRDNLEAFVSLILASIFVQYLENFTLDRLTLLYVIIILYFLDKPKISNVIILLSFLVNEKVMMLLGPLFFIRYFIYKENFSNLIFSCLSVLLYFFMIFTLSRYFGYNFSSIYNESGFYRILLNIFDKSHLSNSIIPIFFCLTPYIISILIKKKFNFQYSNFEILIPFLLWFLAYGGGENNIGRYVMHSIPLWVPIFSCQLIYFLRLDKIIK